MSSTPTTPPTPAPTASPAASPTPTLVPAPTKTKLLAPNVYVAVAGDSLSGIARRYGVSVQALLDANPQIEAPNLIHVGDRIEIPGPVLPSATLRLTKSTTLTADHVGNIEIITDGITLDCAGHTVRGPGLDGANGGISVVGVRGVTVRRCVMEGFVHDGLWASRTRDLLIERNVARGNGWNGFRLERTSDSHLTENRATGNGAADPVTPGIGFWIPKGSDRIVLERNLADGNTMTGFAVEGDAATLVANTARDNALDGISLFDSAACVLNGNTATHNGAWGFRFRSTRELWVENNTEQGDPTAGFGLYDSVAATFIGNHASRSGVGFEVRTSSSSKFSGNTAVENFGATGFALGPGADANTLTNNIANENDNGFLVYGTGEGAADSNFLTENHADRNAMYGFEVANGASFNTIKSNTGSGNGRVDAFQQGDAGAGNRWVSNDFGTTSGF